MDCIPHVIEPSEILEIYLVRNILNSLVVNFVIGAKLVAQI